MEFVTSLKPIVDLFGALLSPIIAITVTYIAYQQWKINRQKINREIRSSKINIYLRVKKFLRNVDETTKIDPDLYQNFQEAVAEADFLLDEEIIEWLNEVDSAASDWVSINEMLEHAEKDSDSRKSFNDYEAWKEKETAYLERSMDILQTAHCNLLKEFKNIVSP